MTLGCRTGQQLTSLGLRFHMWRTIMHFQEITEVEQEVIYQRACLSQKSPTCSFLDFGHAACLPARNSHLDASVSPNHPSRTAPTLFPDVCQWSAPSTQAYSHSTIFNSALSLEYLPRYSTSLLVFLQSLIHWEQGLQSVPFLHLGIAKNLAFLMVRSSLCSHF